MQCYGFQMTSNSYMDSIRSILGSVHRLLNAIKFRAKSDALICLPALLAMQVIDQTVQTQYVGTYVFGLLVAYLWSSSLSVQ